MLRFVTTISCLISRWYLTHLQHAQGSHCHYSVYAVFFPCRQSRRLRVYQDRCALSKRRCVAPRYRFPASLSIQVFAPNVYEPTQAVKAFAPRLYILAGTPQVSYGAQRVHWPSRASFRARQPKFLIAWWNRCYRHGADVSLYRLRQKCGLRSAPIRCGSRTLLADLDGRRRKVSCRPTSYIALVPTRIV